MSVRQANIASPIAALPASCKRSIASRTWVWSVAGLPGWSRCRRRRPVPNVRRSMSAAASNPLASAARTPAPHAPGGEASARPVPGGTAGRSGLFNRSSARPNPAVCRGRRGAGRPGGAVAAPPAFPRLSLDWELLRPASGGLGLADRQAFAPEPGDLRGGTRRTRRWCFRGWRRAADRQVAMA
jgi:hypothetical protein